MVKKSLWAVVDKETNALKAVNLPNGDVAAAIFFRKKDAILLIDKREHKIIEVEVSGV
jgi:hypothetical protein